MAWVIPDRVLRITYKDSHDRLDLKDITDGLAQFHQAGTYPIHVISDNREMDDVDADLNTLRDAFGIMRQEGWGWVMLIGTDRLVTFFAKMISSAFGLDIRQADSPDEALESLRRLDQTLPSNEA